MTSAAGQRVLARSTSFEYPLAKGVAPNPALPPIGTYKPNPITPAQIGTGTDAQELLAAGRPALSARRPFDDHCRQPGGRADSAVDPTAAGRWSSRAS